MVPRAWRLAACGARCWLALHSTYIKEPTPELVHKVVPNTNSPQPLMLKDRSGVLHVRFTDMNLRSLAERANFCSHYELLQKASTQHGHKSCTESLASILVDLGSLQPRAHF